MICLTLAEADITHAVQQAVTYRNDIDMCELRVDYLQNQQPASVAQFPALLAAQSSSTKSVVTLRRVADGGQYDGTDSERLALLRDILTQTAHHAPFQYIDLELDTRGHRKEEEICALARQQGMTIIRSVHDFHPQSHQISDLLAQTTANQHEVGKIAVAVNGLHDVCEMLEQLQAFRAPPQRSTAPIILIAMGEYGQVLRILSRKLGIYCTYCSVPNTDAVAPGQLTPVQLNRLYRYHTINEETKVFAVIGNPIAHSKSPQFHNRIFQTRRRNACYVPIRCDALPALVRLAALLPLSGLSVTLPHKIDIISHLDTSSDDVRVAGACNTVVIRDGKWHGYNTDLYGFEEPLRSAGALSASRQGAKRALIIGAGGVARTACASLLQHGYEICILNRTVQRMQALAQELRSHYPDARIRIYPLSDDSASHIPPAELIVQTTSIGMAPHESDDPIPFYSFRGNELVYDLIYTPPYTAILKRARQAGCKVLNGERMFTLQAEKQSELFLDYSTLHASSNVNRGARG